METAQRILDIAERLCQSRGLEAVSFRDLAAEIGVKSASIHYHFPSKADLALALALRYRQRFETARAEIDRKESSAEGRLRKLFALLSDLYKDPNKVCLAAVLTSESGAVSPEVSAEVRRFFDDNERWIAGVLKLGVKQKTFTLATDADCTAKTIFAAIEGAILASRACADASRIRQVGECVMQSLKSR
jgi:TetR/AcrR family transcriptional regulator, transcriptional repressor for nem operon